MTNWTNFCSEFIDWWNHLNEWAISNKITFFSLHFSFLFFFQLLSFSVISLYPSHSNYYRVALAFSLSLSRFVILFLFFYQFDYFSPCHILSLSVILFFSLFFSLLLSLYFLSLFFFVYNRLYWLAKYLTGKRSLLTRNLLQNRRWDFAADEQNLL